MADETAAVAAGGESAVAAGRLRWLVFCVAFAGMIAAVDDYIVSVSLPVIAADLNATPSEAALVTVVYLLALVGTLLFFGRIGQTWGFRKLLLAGFAVFLAGSVLCAASWGIVPLIAFRALQGTGAAMMSVSGPAIIATWVPPDRKGWAFGILATVTGLGVTLGAPLGGIISGFFGWQMIFLVNVPIVLAAAFLAARFVPRDVPRPRRPGTSNDVVGAVLSMAGLVLIVFGLNRGEEFGGWTSPATVGTLLAGIASLTVFTWWELRHTSPLLQVRSLANRRLLSGIMSALLGYMLLAGCNYLFPFYLSHYQGLQPQQIGAIMMIYALVYMAFSPFAGRWSDHGSARFLSALAMVSAAGASLFVVFAIGWVGLVLPVTYLVWRATSYAGFITANSKHVMDNAATTGAGDLSALLKVSVNLSLVLGVVLLETMFSLTLPENSGSLSSMLDSGKITQDDLTDAFRVAYAAGAAVCLAAAGFALWGRAGAGQEAPTDLK